MATTYTYTVNQGQLQSAVFEKMGVFNNDSPPFTSDINTFNRELNMYIKWLMVKNYNLWCYSDVTITLVQGQTQYLLGPGGTTAFATWRPLRIPMARVHYGAAATGLEVPLIQISRQEYLGMGTKLSQGTPNSYYYDPQLTQGVLNLYLTPDNQPNTVILTCQRPLADALLSTDPLDFPIEWNDALVYGVAARLCFEYDVPQAKADRLEAKAAELLDDMLGWDQESASTFFTPDSRSIRMR